MLGDIIWELILRPIFELILQIIGYFTSRFILPAITFGFIAVAPANKGVKVRPKWHGFNRASNGRIVLHEEMGALLGILIWVLLIVLGVLIFVKE